jgi:hypothetical protein
MGYRFLSGGVGIPKANASVASSASVSTVPVNQPVQPPPPTHPIQPIQAQQQTIQTQPNQPIQPTQSVQFAYQTNNLIDNLLQNTQPRLSWVLTTKDGSYNAGINFVTKEGDILEVLTVEELHGLGVAFLKRPYGFDLLYRGQVYALLWGRNSQKTEKASNLQASTKSTPETSKCVIKAVMTDDEIKACS